jgi:hypothetical protein
MQISPGSGSEINLEITPPTLTIDEWFYIDSLNSELSPSVETGAGLNQIEVQAEDLIIQRATESTQKARVQMVRKYSKKHDIQHCDIGAIV